MDRYSSEDLTETDHDTPQRSDSRDSLLLTANLKIDGSADEVRVRVRNLSAGGLMAEYPDPVSSGTSLQIEIRGVGWVGGRVAWATDGRIGVAFDKHIDPLLARKPVGQGAHTPHYVKPVITRR